MSSRAFPAFPGRIPQPLQVRRSERGLPLRNEALRSCAASSGQGKEGHNKKRTRVMTTPSKPRALPKPGEVRTYPVLPLRDIVVFPHMIVPLFVGREKSIKALEEVMRSDTFILLATQKNASDDDPATERDLRGRHARERAAAAQAARRHGEGAGRGRRARPRDPLRRPPRILRGRGRGHRRPGRREGRGRGDGALGRHRVRELRQAQQEGFAGSRRRRSSDRRLRQARRHRRLPSRDQDPGQAGDPGDALRRRAARACAAPDGQRDLRPAGREAHPHAGQAPDGEDPARVLPQRADEGDPEGARRRGRPRRARRARGQDQEDQALEGGPRQGHPRAQEAAPDVADVGGSHGGAQLPRLAAVDPVGQEVEDQEGSRRMPRRSSITITTASTRSRSASSSISRCRPAPTS